MFHNGFQHPGTHCLQKILQKNQSKICSGFSYRIFKTTYMLTFKNQFNHAYAFIELGHLATSLLSAFCFANVCLLTLSLRNASIPRSTCGDSRSSQLFGQALTLLVAVSSTHYCASTPALSTSSSSRGFTPFGWDISS